MYVNRITEISLLAQVCLAKFISDDQSLRLLREIPNLAVSVTSNLLHSLSTSDHLIEIFNTKMNSATIFWLIDCYFITYEEWIEEFISAGLIPAISISLKNDIDKFPLEIYSSVSCLCRLLLSNPDFEPCIQAVCMQAYLLRGSFISIIWNLLIYRNGWS